MYKLKTIEISKFRGQTTPIRINLKKDANFIIGRNGTGKTTLINLIYAGLAVDISALTDARFDSLRFSFTSTRTRKRPHILVRKRNSEENGDEIVYQVKKASTDPTEEHVFSRSKRRIFITTEGLRRSIPLGSVRQLKESLATIYRTTWLSLQRSSDTFDEEETDDDEDRGSDVDRKLDQVTNELVRYFSRLDRLVAEQTQSFQKGWFLSFLASEKTPTQNSISRINVNDERAALTAIFEKFNMSPDSYDSQLEKHLRLATRASEAMNSSGQIPFRDFIVAFDVLRLHSLVEQWQDLQLRQQQIYFPKTEFVRIASDMLFRKNLQVNRSNQVVVESEASHPIPLKKLSSGEKQLLIFLSETLLQEQAPYIFLADEPELSLHVEWQEELVPNLLKITLTLRSCLLPTLLTL